MSRIITYLKCEKCGKEYDNIYYSFGHPEEDFTWNWKCECNHINKELIKALPMYGIWKTIAESSKTLLNE